MYNYSHIKERTYMNLKTILITLFLLLSVQNLYAAKQNQASFLLEADDSTSFMHFEFHKLAYEAAIEKDYNTSYRIYQKLANKGDDRAEYNLGMMYMKGFGVERKKMDAYKWLRRASKHGNKEASLYFKKMNERYAKTQEEKKPRKRIISKEANEVDVKPVEKELPKEPHKPKSSQKRLEKAPIVLQVAPKTSGQEESNSSSLLAIIGAFVILIIILAFFFLKKSNQHKEKKQDTEQNSPVYKLKVYDLIYAKIDNYHTELLKQVNLANIKNDKEKTQIYYMFLAGVIDYFCQLEKFNDIQQRRVFNTHMGKQEGKENLTAITQIILEGQKNHSMYHYQAAGGVSAQAWNETKSKDSLAMLKKVLSEKRH